MKRTIFAAAALLVVTGLAQDSIVANRTEGQGRTRDQRTDQAPSTKDQGLTSQAIVDRYCVTCHNPRVRAGGLELDALSVSDAHREPETRPISGWTIARRSAISRMRADDRRSA